MRKHPFLFSIILSVSMFGGCTQTCKNEFKLDTINYETTKWTEKLDYSEIKDGYYITDQDSSYFVIKDKTYNLVGIDWEAYCRANISKDGLEIGTSEYEELISEAVAGFNDVYSNKTFVPIRYYEDNGISTDSHIILVTNMPAEEINSGSIAGFRGIEMKDENTIYNDTNNLLYTYCGTSLPESIQTQTSD